MANSLRLLVPLLTLLSSTSLGKNLHGRIGVGGTIHDFNRTAALSAKFPATQMTNIHLLAGFDTSDTSNSAIFGAKVSKNAHMEENLNFYVGIGGFVISDKVADSVASGWELDGLLGVEFFLTGLPNLGFMVESGVALRTIRKVSFKSLASGLANIGIHYYF